MWKMGACIALSAAMMLTSVGSMLPSDWGIDTVYADETKNKQDVHRGPARRKLGKCKVQT